EQFNQRGLKTPDQYEQEGRWTFDTFLELARGLTRGNGESKVWGAPWFTVNLDIHQGFIWPFGGDLWDKALQNTLLDSKEALEAIQFMGDLTYKYGAAHTQTEIDQIPGGTV